MANFSVKALKIVHKDLPLYLFGMPAGQVLDISYVLPKSRDDPEAIERVLDNTRVEQISSFIGKADSYLPGAILINFDPDGDNLVEFADKGGESIIQIKLPDESKDEIRKQIRQEVEAGTLEADTDADVDLEVERRLTKVAYVIDGQHRLKGLERAGKLQLILPVVALNKADLKKAAKIFADINGEQRPVPPNTILLIRYEIGDLPDLRAQATSVAHELNERADSPFHSKVKIYEQDTGTWLTAISLQRMLYPIVSTGPLQNMTVNEQTVNFISFFNALKAQCPGAFDDETRKQYILTQPRGIEAALGLFDRVWRRCQAYEGNSFDHDSILRQIKRLDVMNWKKEKYGQLKGAGGVEFLIDQLLLLVPERDDREPKNYKQVVKWFERPELILGA
jgi:DGQHR domain-containing protein